MSGAGGGLVFTTHFCGRAGTEPRLSLFCLRVGLNGADLRPD